MVNVFEKITTVSTVYVIFNTNESQTKIAITWVAFFAFLNVTHFIAILVCDSLVLNEDPLVCMGAMGTASECS